MKKYLLIIISLTICRIAIAQNAATNIWTDAFGIQDTVLKIPTVLDNNGNLYVAGSSIDSLTGPNIAIKKYDQNGEPLFTINYSGSGNYRDQATALAIDSNQNLIVAGFSYINSTNNYDFLVLKYDSTGTLLWSYTYNGTSSAADIVSAIVIDTTNIYITGASMGYLTLFDYATIKLNSAGSQVWLNRYNYLGNDFPFDIDIADNNIFVNGGSQSTITNYDYARLQYTPAGTTVDTLRSTGVGFEHVTHAVTDVNGSVYVTGAEATLSNGLDYKTIKFDNQGNIIWSRTFDNTAHEDDIANAITIDVNGNVFVTGESQNSLGNNDYCTIKYDSVGTVIWTRYYNNNYNDEPKAITMDMDNNVIITGISNNASNKDFATIAYNNDGDTLWVKRFNGLYNGHDYATTIVERDGLVYVTGQSQVSSTQYQNITIAYGQAKIKEIPDVFNEAKGANHWFIPNNGQLPEDTVNNIEYYVPNHNPALYYNMFGLSYVFSKIDNDTATTDTLHRIDMNFMKGTAIAKNDYYPSEELSTHYNNYYLPSCPNGVIDVYGSNMLYVKDLYPNIDLYYSSNEKGLKHYFVLAPEAKIKGIGIDFNGADSVSTPIGKYTIHSSIGKLEYDSLIAYEMDAAGNIISGTSQAVQLFADSNGVYHFVQFSYNTSNYLVVMAKQKVQILFQNLSSESLNWSTFVGSLENDHSKALAVTNNDEIFLGGSTMGIDFPSSNGLNVFNPNTIYEDVFVTKFEQNRKMSFVTFYGSNGSDYIGGLAIDANGNILIAGSSNGDNLPNVSNNGINYSYNSSLANSSNDGFFLVLNNTGNNILCDSYIGGDDSDHLHAIDINGTTGNIALAGSSNSINDFPYTPLGGAFNQGIVGVARQGVIIELDSDYDIIWCTALGGTGREVCTDIAYEGERLFVTGHTNSTELASQNTSNTPCEVPSDGSFPNCILNGSGNFNQVAINGAIDVFITEFDLNRQMYWSTVFGGDGIDMHGPYWADYPFGKFAVTENYLYIAGVSDDSNNFPQTTNANFFENFSISNNSNGYIAKFSISTEGNRGLLWSTFLNGLGDFGDIYFVEADDNYVGITGFTETANINLDICDDSSPGVSFNTCNFSGNNYMETNISGNTGRTFLKVFDNQEQLVWSSLYGANQGNLGYNLCFGNSNIYLTGSTGSQWTLADLPGTIDYFQPNYIGNNDATIATFDASSLYNSIKRERNSISLLVYPNPANSILNISTEEQITSIEIFDFTGKLIILKPIKLRQTEEINIEKLTPGIYLLRATTINNKTLNQKFIKR